MQRHRCQARVEYIAIQSKVEELLSKGHSMRSAYDIFHDNGKISMSYDTFRRYILGKFTKFAEKKTKCIASKVKHTTENATISSEPRMETGNRDLPAPIHNGTITISQPDVSEILKGDIDVDYLINGRK